MATRRVEIGPTGETVRANVKMVREDQKLTLRDLSEKMSETGHPMAHNTISEIERGARRVDVDDLTALAKALKVPTSYLLGQEGGLSFEDVDDLLKHLWASGAIELKRRDGRDVSRGND
jgi:transcriptional regulator with XRE-family HTH domain